MAGRVSPGMPSMQWAWVLTPMARQRAKSRRTLAKLVDFLTFLRISSLPDSTKSVPAKRALLKTLLSSPAVRSRSERQSPVTGDTLNLLKA